MDNESHGSVGLPRKQIDPGNRVGDQDLRYPHINNQMKVDDMFPKYMMATTAIHLLGDISSSTPDLCIIHKEDGDNYIGNWVTGLGFIDVNFPKATTRDLTNEEVDHYNGRRIAVYGAMSGKKSYDCGTLNIKQS